MLREPTKTEGRFRTLKNQPRADEDSPEKGKITIVAKGVGDCDIVIYEVTLETDTSSWSETFGSRIELEAFLRGMKAITSMADLMGFHEPAIPG